MSHAQFRDLFNDKNFTKMYAEGAEKFTGWSAVRLVKATKIDQASDEDQLVVLDQASGTGIVAQTLADALNDKQKANLELTCADFADSMLDFLKTRVNTLGVKHADVHKADAMDTKLPADKFSHIFLNFGPMVYTDHQAGIRELLRLLKPGGIVAMSSWKEVGWINDIRAAFESRPELPKFPAEKEFREIMNQGGHWDEPQWIKDEVAKAGFTEVHTEEMPHTSTMKGVDEFARFTGGMVGMLQKRLWTAEQREKYSTTADEVVASYMKNKYGDGEIKWNWVAILTTARKAA